MKSKKEQKRFIKNLCDSVKLDLISKLEGGKVPENWDGIELREWIADSFRNEAYYFRDKRNARYKNYVNDRIVNNL